MLAGALAAPLGVEAQQAAKVYRVGFLRAGQPPKTFVEAFQQGLRERGYFDGQNVVIEFRFTEGSVDQLKVDVILGSGSSAAVAAKKATTSVPLVFASQSYSSSTAGSTPGPVSGRSSAASSARACGCRSAT